MNIEPWSGSFFFLSIGQPSPVGIVSPSYQVRGNGSTVNAVPGNTYLTMFFVENDSGGGASLSERIVFGWVSASAPAIGSRMWMDMSPIVPQPKSVHIRQFPGW